MTAALLLWLGLGVLYAAAVWNLAWQTRHPGPGKVSEPAVDIPDRDEPRISVRPAVPGVFRFRGREIRIGMAARRGR
jgi:hypothetical protein